MDRSISLFCFVKQLVTKEPSSCETHALCLVEFPGLSSLIEII